MILIDSNILIYAHVLRSPLNQVATAWLNEQLAGDMRVGLPWPSLLAFLRVVTNPRIFPDPEPMTEAWRQVAEWLSSDNVWTPQPGEHHRRILGELLTHAGVQGNLVMDAHLAALAIEHGLLLCSADSDFAKFPGLRWTNPLVQDKAQ